MYFISFLRLATEQHSTLPQKGGINGKVYLLNKMNNFTSSRPTFWLKSSRNCSGGWRGLVGGFSYYIKIFYQIYCIKIYEKGENLKVRSTEEYWCQFGFIHWPFFRGRRQGRQPLNNIYIMYYNVIYPYISTHRVSRNTAFVQQSLRQRFNRRCPTPGRWLHGFGRLTYLIMGSCKHGIVVVNSHW